jgi:hypothetical protein
MTYKFTARERRDLLKKKVALEESIKKSQKTITKLRKRKDDTAALALAGALESTIRYSKRQVQWVNECLPTPVKSSRKKQP